MSGLEMLVKQERRLCTVNGETGYFHIWEQYSQPIEPSPMVSGHIGGVVSYILGIVEFEDGVRRVDPTEIKFCDEEHEMLSVFNIRKENEERMNMCEYCEGGKALVIGKTNDQGITIQYPNRLNAYGYDIHGTGRNGLVTRINYCPMCGKKLKGE